MTLLGSDTLKKIRAGHLSLGLGVHHLRGAAVPLIAKAAGYDWLFIEGEHGAINSQATSAYGFPASAAMRSGANCGQLSGT